MTKFATKCRCYLQTRQNKINVTRTKKCLDVLHKYVENRMLADFFLNLGLLVFYIFCHRHNPRSLRFTWTWAQRQTNIVLTLTLNIVKSPFAVISQHHTRNMFNNAVSHTQHVSYILLHTRTKILPYKLVRRFFSLEILFLFLKKKWEEYPSFFLCFQSI